MSRTKKPASLPTYKRLLRLSAFLVVFALGLVVAAIQPAAVLALLALVVLVVLVLLGESFYLWQLIKRKELSKRVRVKRPVVDQEVTQSGTP
jgi:uncharacterized protein (DUF58 family)